MSYCDFHRSLSSLLQNIAVLKKFYMQLLYIPFTFDSVQVETRVTAAPPPPPIGDQQPLDLPAEVRP